MTRQKRRSATGCITCKIRRVKCDEGRPCCTRCSSTGRKCDGYLDRTPAPNQPAPAALLVIWNLDVDLTTWDRDHVVRTGFRFFADMCAPVLLNYGSHFFWTQLVLQAGQACLSVKHLIVAVSRLACHNLGLLPGVESPMDDRIFLSHYGQALKSFSQTKNLDQGIALMACLLLILCDEFQQRPFAALQHIIAGRKILASYCANRSTYRNTTVEEIGPIFSKLELRTGELNQQTQPSHTRWQLPTAHYSVDVIDLQPFSNLGVFARMASTLEAAKSLQTIAAACTSLRLTGQPPQTRFHTVPLLTDQLNTWFEEFSRFDAGMSREITPASRAELQLLRTYHLCLHVLSRCAPFDQECAFDIYSGAMDHIMVCAGLLIPFTTTRLIPILFLVATRYRSVSFRRRAIEMLSQCGLDGQILARIALKVVQLEERRVKEPIVSADIPEASRIRLVDLSLDADGSFYTLRFRRSPYTDELTPIERVSLPTQGFSWTSSEGYTQTSGHACQLLSEVLKFNFMAFWNQESLAFALPRGFDAR
ncbi:hypothetical protein A1O3_09740 [Capronia epimyces CBS 606.96]|uniref:Zn(2)-C6 fungal-type domain-containing protein n=1 Tax=Capronia epimyces CBS 606.96 TaxID=1182542 RepID=W9XBC6_9EURO|nr:uncharacterized protein A1O3_09740 [Capronia epimyces CBS 606.96]EXJ77513.1 hypothetical protein A1O3_09740 [Capronia epimyces CBS 606.96]